MLSEHLVHSLSEANHERVVVRAISAWRINSKLGDPSSRDYSMLHPRMGCAVIEEQVRLS